MFKKALELDPKYALAHAGLAGSHTQRAIRFGYSVSWLDSALSSGNKAVSLDPDLAEGYQALGRLFISQGRIQRSLEANRRALELNPNHAPAAGITSYGYFFLGHLAEAVRWTKRVMEINPANAFWRAQMGAFYLALNEGGKSNEWFQEGL